jgi:hypothetical protein
VDEKMIEKLAGAMVYCQVDVCGIGMFRAPDFAKEVVEALKQGGYEIEIRPTQRVPDAIYCTGCGDEIIPLCPECSGEE